MTTDPVLLEIQTLAGQLHPREFLLRIHDWRSNGFGAGGLSEQVKKSSTYPIPVDKDGNLPDRVDRELQQAARAYKDSIDDAVRLLRTASALEAKYLYEIRVASEDMRELVRDDDDPTCLCSKTSAEWGYPKKHKTPWRIKSGFGPCCYGPWSEDGRPDKVQWIRTNRANETVTA